MNIQEMHNVFRVLGQQMGIQLVRGILPESIDIYLNNSIVDTAQQELLMGVRTVFQENTNTQSSTINPINSFRHLYRSARYKINVNALEPSPTDDGSIIYGKVNYYNSANGYHIINIPTIDSNVAIEKGEYSISPMMFLGFSVEYKNTERGNPVACRLIGADVLETTLRDYCNGASKDSPIACLNSIPIISNNKEQVNGISNEQLEIYINSKDTDIKYLNVKYIKTPNVVKYDMDIDKCVNCDLPAYTHYGIVERAVYKFYQSVGATSNNQEKQQ